MRILIVYRHFWPDSTPYASMLRSIARRLASDGHHITIWTESPCYSGADLKKRVVLNETIDNVSVERIATLPGIGRFQFIRKLDTVLFPVRALIRAVSRKFLGQNFDLVWTATIPPVIQGACGRWISSIFRSKFLYHCQDLYPELAIHMQIWPPNSFLTRALKRIEAKNRAKADLLVTLSGDMARTIRQLQEPAGEVALINNFMLEDFGQEGASIPGNHNPTRSGNPSHKTSIQLIFAGNVGHFQGLDRVVEAMRIADKEKLPIDLTIMGSGKALPDLQEQANNLANIKFLPYQDFSIAKSIIESADIGIIALEPGMQNFAFPSKTLTYLGVGLPLMLISDPGSELAELISNNDIGFSPRLPDVEGIATCIRQITERRDELGRMQARSKRLYSELFTLEAVLDRWSTLIQNQGNSEKPKRKGLS